GKRNRPMLSSQAQTGGEKPNRESLVTGGTAARRALVKRLLWAALVVAVVLVHVVIVLVRSRDPRVTGYARRPVGPVLGRQHAARGVDLAGEWTLLNEANVQKDLGLTEDQVSRLRSAFEKNGLRSAARFRKWLAGNVPPDFHTKDPKGSVTLQKIHEDERHDQDSAARAVLSTEQYRRLQQITFQSKGLLSHVTDPHISSQMGLTTDQRTQIAALLKAKAAKEAEIRSARQDSLKRARAKDGSKGPPKRPTQADREALRKFVDQLSNLEQEALRSVESLLTQDQKLTYSSMTGPRFDFSE
ncbi:MAG: hypothetical protein ACP5XB_10460, partial [Isosphaeraceae bacterium]